MRYALAVVVAMTVVLVAGPSAAGGGGGGGARCPGFGERNEVRLEDSCFAPTALFSEPGTLRVRNVGEQPHTYTAVDGSFDTGTLQAGEQATVTVAAGVHRVICKLHSSPDGEGMAGVLIAGDTAAPAGLASAVTSGTPATASGDQPVLPVAALVVAAVALLLALDARRRVSGQRGSDVS